MDEVQEKPRVAWTDTGRGWKATCRHGSFHTDSWDDAIHWALGCFVRKESTR